jgi:hypothetical protein
MRRVSRSPGEKWRDEVILTLDAARERLHKIAGVIIEKREELLEVRRRLPYSRLESSPEDLDADPSVATEMRAVIGCVVQDYLTAAARDLHAAADYQPARRKNGMARAGLDLHSDSEETRRALYDLVVRDNFTPKGPEDLEGESFPPYTPEEAGLKVYFEHGRWFATWVKLEEPEDLPEAERRELLVLAEAPDEPGRLVYRGV